MCQPYACIMNADGRLYEGQMLAEHSHKNILQHYGLWEPAFSSRWALLEVLPVPPMPLSVT